MIYKISRVTKPGITNRLNYFGEGKKAEVVSMKQPLVPVFMHALSSKSFWIESITIPYRGRYERSRATSLRLSVSNRLVDFLNITPSATYNGRSSKSRRPSALYLNAVSVKAAWLTLYNMMAVEELYVQYEDGREDIFLQPLFVLAAPFKTRTRQLFQKDNDNVYHTLNTEFVAMYVADEFDSASTWDPAMRKYFKEEIMPILRAYKISIRRMPAKDLKDSLFYTPHFKDVSPFKNDPKMIREAHENSHNHYTSI